MHWPPDRQLSVVCSSDRVSLRGWGGWSRNRPGRCKGVRVRKVGKKTPSWQVAVKNALPRSITAEPQDRQKMWMAESVRRETVSLVQ